MNKQKTPLQAVRKFCVECCGGSKPDVKTCRGDRPIMGGDYPNCPLFPHRGGRKRISVKTIRKHCIICTNNSHDAIRECPSTKCPLYPFRMGTNPNYKEETKKLKSKLAKKQGLSKIGLRSRVNKKDKAE
jgi:hypothetical protein